MTHIEWHEQLLVGHEFMDRDHRKFVDLINAVLDALNDSDLPLFEDNIALLQQHALAHLENEEHAMRESGYERMEAHAHDHRCMCVQLDVFNAAMSQGLLVPGEHEISFLRDWMLSHLANFDRPLAEHLRQVGSAEEPRSCVR